MDPGPRPPELPQRRARQPGGPHSERFPWQVVACRNPLCVTSEPRAIKRVEIPPRKRFVFNCVQLRPIRPSSSRGARWVDPESKEVSSRISMPPKSRARRWSAPPRGDRGAYGERCRRASWGSVCNSNTRRVNTEDPHLTLKSTLRTTIQAATANHLDDCLSGAEPELAERVRDMADGVALEAWAGNHRYLKSLGQRAFPLGERVRLCHDIISSGAGDVAVRSTALSLVVLELAGGKVADLLRENSDPRAVCVRMMRMSTSLGTGVGDDDLDVRDRVRAHLAEYAGKDTLEVATRCAALTYAHGAVLDGIRALKRAYGDPPGAATSDASYCQHEAGLIVGTAAFLARSGQAPDLQRIYHLSLTDAERGQKAAEACRHALEGVRTREDASRVAREVADILTAIDSRVAGMSVEEVADAIWSSRGRGKAPVHRAVAEIAVRCGAFGANPGADLSALAKSWRDCKRR